MNPVRARLILVLVVGAAFAIGSCNSLSGADKITIDDIKGKSSQKATTAETTGGTTGMGGMNPMGPGGMGGN